MVSKKSVSGWISRGYDWRLDLSGTDYVMSDLGPMGRRVIDRGQFAAAFECVSPGPGGSIRLRRRGDVTDYFFDPGGALEPECRPSQTPRLVFQALCAIFERHYAFFGLREVDWPAQARHIAAKVTDQASPDALLDRIEELIAPLRDSHVSVTAPHRCVAAESPIAVRRAVLPAALGIPPLASDRNGYTQGLCRSLRDFCLRDGGRSNPNGSILWGAVEPGLGYVAMLGEFGHANTPLSRAAEDLPRPNVQAAAFLADEISAVSGTMNRVASDLQDMRALIVDVRFNYGGYDRIALDLAGLFTERRRPAYRKKTWMDQRIVAEQTIDLIPRDGQGLAHIPVYLLTSRQTVSAGEVFVLAMRTCPNVTVIGESTLGILSDNLYKQLPNGWELSLSNEIYETLDGQSFEGCGIPPDVRVPTFDDNDVPAMLGAAFQCAKELSRARQ